MNWLSLISQGLQILVGGIVFTLHATGADKHKTIAGQVASILSDAAVVAAAADSAARNAPPPPGTASSTP
jgi:hypothetical protein